LSVVGIRVSVVGMRVSVVGMRVNVVGIRVGVVGVFDGSLSVDDVVGVFDGSLSVDNVVRGGLVGICVGVAGGVDIDVGVDVGVVDGVVVDGVVGVLGSGIAVCFFWWLGGCFGAVCFCCLILCFDGYSKVHCFGHGRGGCLRFHVVGIVNNVRNVVVRGVSGGGSRTGAGPGVGIGSRSRVGQGWRREGVTRVTLQRIDVGRCAFGLGERLC